MRVYWFRLLFDNNRDTFEKYVQVIALSFQTISIRLNRDLYSYWLLLYIYKYMV